MASRKKLKSKRQPTLADLRDELLMQQREIVLLSGEVTGGIKSLHVLMLDLFRQLGPRLDEKVRYGVNEAFQAIIKEKSLAERIPKHEGEEVAHLDDLIESAEGD